MKHSLYFLYAVLLSAIVALISSCLSTQGAGSADGKNGLKKINEDNYLLYLNKGDYNSCIEYLQKRLSKKNNDAIRDYFDVAMLKHYQGSYNESLTIMNHTDSLMHEAAVKSISKGVAAAVFNENAAEYAGTPYEYIYINIFNALNYYNSGDFDEACVEIRKLNNKQKEYLVKYGEIVDKTNFDEDKSDDEDASASKSVAKAYKTFNMSPADFNAGKPAKPGVNDIFSDSAASRYISMLFYLMDGDTDNAQVDARRLKKYNQAFDTSSVFNITKGKGRIDVISFSGLIGRRGEGRTILGPIIGLWLPSEDSNGNAKDIVIPPFDIEFAYPVFPAPQVILHKSDAIPSLGKPPVTIGPGKAVITPAAPDTITEVHLVMDDGTVKKFDMLEDFNYAVNQDVNIKARRAYGRSVRRSLIKKISAITTGSVVLSSLESKARNSGNVLAMLACDAYFVTMAKAVDAVDMTETADIRQVYALPGKARATGIELDPGVHSFKVQYFNEDRLIFEQSFENIVVKSGQTVLVESLCQK